MSLSWQWAYPFLMRGASELRVCLVHLGGIPGGSAHLMGWPIAVPWAIWGLGPIPFARLPLPRPLIVRDCAAEDYPKLGVGLCGPSLHSEGCLACANLALG